MLWGQRKPPLNVIFLNPGEDYCNQRIKGLQQQQGTNLEGLSSDILLLVLTLASPNAPACSHVPLAVPPPWVFAPLCTTQSPEDSPYSKTTQALIRE